MPAAGTSTSSSSTVVSGSLRPPGTRLAWRSRSRPRRRRLRRLPPSPSSSKSSSCWPPCWLALLALLLALLVRLLLPAGPAVSAAAGPGFWPCWLPCFSAGFSAWLLGSAGCLLLGLLAPASARPCPAGCLPGRLVASRWRLVCSTVGLAGLRVASGLRRRARSSARPWSCARPGLGLGLGLGPGPGLAWSALPSPRLRGRRPSFGRRAAFGVRVLVVTVGALGGSRGARRGTRRGRRTGRP